MKRFSIYFMSLLMASSGFTACSLDEVNKSSLDSGSYFTGETQYEQLVSEAYLTMRPLMRITIPMWYGTDLYECQGSTSASDARTPTNDYTVMNGDEYLDYWNNCYNVIAKVNTALTRGENIPDISEETKKLRTAELKALRAFCYFNLVENFGKVPVVLAESSEAIYNFTQESEETIYTQILQDLNDAINDLPDNANNSDTKNFGRVTKGFVYHMLAKVYLTRSYKNFGNKTEDLKSTITNADKALALHPVSTDPKAWEIMFDDFGSEHSTFKQNTPEIIFSIRYSTNQTYNGSWGTENTTWGNNLYQEFKFELEKLACGSVIAGPYWRCQYTYQPTKLYLNELFDGNDVRGSEQFLQRHIVAAETDENYPNIQVGDEIIYCPRTAMTEAEKAAYKAQNPSVLWIVNPNEYHEYLSGTIYNGFPIVWKFFDSGIQEYTNDQRDPKGTRDTYVFRSAETLLLKAEALVQQGNGSSMDATTLINQLRDRAGADRLTTAATIDDVLDESARELFGEANRWMDLKRTGKLFERAWKYNAWIQKHHSSVSDISDIYLLRPIPISEISYSNYSLIQNPGFPGAK